MPESKLKSLRVMLDQGFDAPTQPTPMTCVQTCLAMILSVPAEDVIARYGADGLNQKRLCHALTECGVSWNQFMHGDLVASGWYLLGVPSLNHRGLGHQIIVHVDTERGCSGITVFDPARETKYKRDGSDLRSWADAVHFIPGGRLPKPETWRPFQANDRASYPPDNTRVLLKHIEGRDGVCLGMLMLVSPSHGRTWRLESMTLDTTTAVDPTEWCPLPR